MNGIEKITQRITEDIDREIADIQAQAKQQADAIAADYTQRAQKEGDDIRARGALAAKEREENLASMAQMEAKKQLLTAKQSMLTKAFALAQEKLLALPQDEYISLLAKLAAKASKNGSEAVIFSEKDRESVGAAVVEAANKLPNAGKLTLSAETRPMAGGLILSDGEIEVNCSFETLLRLQEAEIAGEVAGVLFQ